MNSTYDKLAMKQLSNLGVFANYTGYFHAVYALELSLQEPHRLQYVGKELYPEMAKHFKTSITCIERNIRTICSVAWKNNAALLSEMAGYPLSKKPSNSEFLAIILAYIMMNY